MSFRAILIVLLVGCGTSPPVGPGPATPAHEEAAPAREAADPAPAPAGRATLTVVGTNDVHGHAMSVARLGGFVANLRAAREADGGAVLLIDGGDMWQGTLESNLGEGAALVKAYNAVGYTAAAIGNHEFDYGPVGEAATPREEGDDRRGALLARVAEAHFPILNANLLMAATGQRVHWDGVAPSVMIEAAGVQVGIIGVTTEETLSTTIAGNVDDLAMATLRETVTTEARSLRERGAGVVLVAAHAGGDCDEFVDAHDLSSCDPDEEIFHLAEALPRGLVDLIVAGHTHAGVAHFVNGVAIIESYAYGYAFGRIDLVFDRGTGRVVDRRIFPPQPLCPGGASRDDCPPVRYEGRPVEPDPRVMAAIAPALERAEVRRNESLGVTLLTDIRRHHRRESPLGNLLTDLMRQARPAADVAIINGGGIRASLDRGRLTYGQLYETFPFDNRFATVKLSGAELKQLYRDTLVDDDGIYSISGMQVVATCRDGALDVDLRRPGGQPVRDDEVLDVLVSDFLATGTDPVFVAARRRNGDVRIEDDPPIRDELAAALRARGGQLRADDRSLFDPRRPRIRLPGDGTPVHCDAHH